MPLHLKSTGIDFADFGNTGATLDSELFGDYEYGSYQQVLTPATGGGTINLAGQWRYIQLAHMVTISGRCEVSSVTGTHGGNWWDCTLPMSSSPHASTEDFFGSTFCLSTNSSSSYAVYPVITYSAHAPRFMLDASATNSSYRIQPHLNYVAALG